MRNGKHQLGDLYKQYAKPLYYYVLKLCGSKQLAEDLTQDTFVRANISCYIGIKEMNLVLGFSR